MMPRIEAAETLTAATATALGSGALKKADASRLRSSLLRQTNKGARRRAMKASPAILGMMGIAVEVSDGG